MDDLTFQMRLHCRYNDSANNVEQLKVEHLVKNAWQALALDINSPGFDVFIYAILTCQHMYFRLNAAERDLTLDSSEGLITVRTDMHRLIKSLHVEFKSKLKGGAATDEAVAYIKERMGLCPVSTNLKAIEDSKATISFLPWNIPR